MLEMTPIIQGVHRVEKKFHYFWPNDKRHHNFIPYAVQVFIFLNIFCKMAKICDKKIKPLCCSPWRHFKKRRKLSSCKERSLGFRVAYLEVNAFYKGIWYCLLVPWNFGLATWKSSFQWGLAIAGCNCFSVWAILCD